MIEIDNNVTQAIEIYIEKVKVREKNSLINVILSSFFAGFMIALGAFGSINVASQLPLGLAKLTSGIVFSSGLIMIVLCGTELFTGNVLTSFHFFKNGFKINSFMKLWVLVYFGNLLGCLAAAFLLNNSGLLNDFQDKFNSIVVVKTSLSFVEAFIRGIFCNILVCLAVIIANEAKTVQGKILGIIVPITLFIASGYEHCVANMFFLPAGKVSLMPFLHNIVPVTLGNVAGAFIMAYLLFLTAKISKNA